ncbi:PAS domain-containing protein [Halostagnicola kamekurae]|uniref:histidine kinase n=1 Tax=Halostagnicola kamekurae TaxID=619731 RepID=A0A1I6RUS7_9EURY|nr:PAS domain-containing protein [Halostagnicola kamekurae]SFS68350.1 PAS domain S-box-containing protein [Halostagnicola kamekurae]
MATSDHHRAALRSRTRQQEAVAALGQRALETDDVDELLCEGAEVVAETLPADCCGVFESIAGDELCLRAGHGWESGSVGTAAIPTDDESDGTPDLLSALPVAVAELAADPRFDGAELFDAHELESGLCVGIGPADDLWGVLGAYTAERREFDDHEEAFLRSVGNVLASAIDTGRAKRSLRDAETLTDRIVETSPVGITVIDDDGRNVFANSRGEELLGRPLETLRSYDHDDDRWNLVDATGDPLSGDDMPFSRVEETGESVHGERLGIDHPDGTRVWLSAHCAPLTDDDGEFDGAVYALEDVTERTRLEHELETTLDRVTDAFYSLDDDWRFTYLNDRAEELIDFHDRGLVGETIWEAFEWTADSTLRAEYERAMATQEPTSFEFYYPDPLERWFEINVYPSETGLSVYFQDISEQKDIERERTQNTETLHRLYSIASDQHRSFDEKVDQMLEIGRERLGLEVGYLAKTDLEADRFEVTHASGESDNIYPGSVAPLSETYCQRTIEADGLFGFADISTIGATDTVDDRIYDRWNLDCYLGGEVIVDDERYGTLCFEDTSPRSAPFTQTEETFVELITQWVSYELGRQRREKHLQRYVRYIDAVLDTIDDVFCIIDGGGQLRRWNETLPEITGYSPAELESVHVSTFFALADDTVERAIEQGFETGQIRTEAPLRTRDGETLEYEFVVSALETPEGETVLAGIGRDISRRKARERALEESERRYRILVEQFPNGAVALFDEELRYTLVGGQSVHPVDTTVDDIVGATLWERYPAALATELEPHFRAALEGERRSFDFEYLDSHWHAHTLPISDEDGTVFAGMMMVQDITERVRSKRKLEELVDELEESNERLEQFAYAASHDLQEPLRMVSSYLTLVERRYGDVLGEEGTEFIDFAVDGADRMQEMIDGLLAYSRVDTGGNPFEPVDCERLLEDVLADLEMKIDETDAEITVESLPTVHGDPGQLRQLFQNLLDNALTYAGGESPRVTVFAEQSQSSWTISVRDSGIGIDPADADRIFEVFNRLHSVEEYAGAGIGLALCQRIAERHDGRIWVDSNGTDGSTFSVHLPARLQQ